MAQEPAATPAPVQDAGPLARYATFDDGVALVRARRDRSLLGESEGGVRLVRYAPGRSGVEPSDAAPPERAARLAQRLQLWTGARWGVAVVGSGGAETIAAARAARKGDLRARALEHPMVQAVLAAFPGADVRDVRPPEAAGEAAVVTDEDDDEWDPIDPFSEE
jgi:DNA polymerase-3 subunit gamma/tau